MSKYNYNIEFVPASDDIPVGYIPTQKDERVFLDISKITNLDLNLDVPFEKLPGNGSRVIIPSAISGREMSIFEHGIRFTSDCTSQ